MSSIGSFLRDLFGLTFLGDDPNESKCSQLPICQHVSLTNNHISLMNNKNSNNNQSSIDLKIVCISDTHLLHNYLEVPDGDILIHTGDFGHFRRGGEQTAKEFNQWLGSLNHKIKLIIAGNHTTFASNYSSLSETKNYLRKLFSNAFYIQDELVFLEINKDLSMQVRFAQDVSEKSKNVIAQLNIYGYPWTHKRSFVYRANAFCADLNRRRTLVANIPQQIDILMTHAPPFGVRDRAVKPEGCLALRDAWQLGSIRPALWVFGHCHGDCGAARFGAPPFVDTLFVNAAQECSMQPVLLTLSVPHGHGVTTLNDNDSNSSPLSSNQSTKKTRKRTKATKKEII